MKVYKPEMYEIEISIEELRTLNEAKEILFELADMMEQHECDELHNPETGYDYSLDNLLRCHTFLADLLEFNPTQMY